MANRAERLPTAGVHAILKWVKRFHWPNCQSHWQWLHPCTIDQRRYLVHHPKLESFAPDYYAQLQRHAQKYGWELKPCRRTPTPTSYSRAKTCRRTAWVPLWMMACALTSGAGAAYADQTSTHLYAIGADNDAWSTTHPLDDPSTDAIKVSPNDAQQRIYQVLLEHWQSTDNDPPRLADDLRKMSVYYGQFPAVVQLFQQLAEVDWQLSYAPKTFTTRISGSRLQVKSVAVLFDPRSAAQFKFYRACANKVSFCVASPADVLLHELLHVQSVLKAPQTFIAQGGMNAHVYPYEHERETIHRERLLYKAMTAIDKSPRPLRSEHQGRHLAVSCATCLM